MACTRKVVTWPACKASAAGTVAGSTYSWGALWAPWEVFWAKAETTSTQITIEKTAKKKAVRLIFLFSNAQFGFYDPGSPKFRKFPCKLLAAVTFFDVDQSKQ